MKLRIAIGIIASLVAGCGAELSAPEPSALTSPDGGTSATGELLTLGASGRSGESISSTPPGLVVASGSTGSHSFAAGQNVTLSVSNGRDVIWSGACSSGGAKTKTCTLTINSDVSETANIQ